ncbi:MAG: hypothetical protein ABSC32_18905 [Steroidobacteraceae bacterium]
MTNQFAAVPAQINQDIDQWLGEGVHRANREDWLPIAIHRDFERGAGQERGTVDAESQKSLGVCDRCADPRQIFRGRSDDFDFSNERLVESGDHMNLPQAERFGCAGQGKGHHQYKCGFRVRHALLQDYGIPASRISSTYFLECSMCASARNFDAESDSSWQAARNWALPP